VAVAGALLGGARNASAHAASDAYLTLAPSPHSSVTLEGRWDIPVSDLGPALGIANAQGGPIPSQVVRTRAADIAELAFSHLSVESNETPCTLSARELEFTDHDGEIHVRLPFIASCATGSGSVDLDYSLFFDAPPGPHEPRALVQFADGPRSSSVVLTPGSRHAHFVRGVASRVRELGSAVRAGLVHIASGLDHLLFLLALLLPSVLVRDPTIAGERRQVRPVATFGAAAVGVLKVVTAFTAAHSLTLALAALGVVHLSSRVVEPAIAASVFVAAIRNVVQPAGPGAWHLAFALGLLHGFGFSTALLGLDLGRTDLVVTLLGFNAGVELGQLALVAAFLPLAYFSRSSGWYRPVALLGGSLAIALVAAVWCVERVRG
jgi:hypothetical protein